MSNQDPSAADVISQACAVPFRRRRGKLEFCLITSSSGKRWGFPKGIVEDGDSPEETALTEAWEEAGIQGHLVGDPIGSFRYRKWNSDLEVVAYLIEVTRSVATWDEADVRERCWVSIDEAFEIAGRRAYRDLLKAACDELD